MLYFPFCNGTFRVPLDDDPLWSTERHSVHTCLPPTSEKKQVQPTHVPKYYHNPHLQSSVWAEAAPSCHPVKVQQPLPLDAEGIVGPVTDHPYSSSGARLSSRHQLPKAAIHKWQQRPGLGALLVSIWRWSGSCLPPAELTHTDSHSNVSSRTRMS